MPGKAKKAKAGSEGATILPAVNGMDEAKVRSYISSIELEELEIREIDLAADKKKQPHKDEIARLKKEAAKAGIPKAPLGAKLRERKFLHKAATVTVPLNEGEREMFEEIGAKSVDLPYLTDINRPQEEGDGFADDMPGDDR